MWWMENQVNWIPLCMLRVLMNHRLKQKRQMQLAKTSCDSTQSNVSIFFYQLAKISCKWMTFELSHLNSYNNFPQQWRGGRRRTDEGRSATRREWQVKMHDTNDEAAAAVSQSSAMATRRVVHAVCFIRGQAMRDSQVRDQSFLPKSCQKCILKDKGQN